MAIKKHKPTSPGRRFSTWSDRAEVTHSEPEKSLVRGLTKSGGRNSRGRVGSFDECCKATESGDGPLKGVVPVSNS